MGGQLLQRITDADKLSSIVWCRGCVGYVTSKRLGKTLANVCCSKDPKVDNRKAKSVNVQGRRVLVTRRKFERLSELYEE